MDAASGVSPREDRHEMSGPEDEPDEELNGDPTSLVGEEDFEGFEEMDGYPAESGLDDGFDDAEIDEDDEDEDDEDE